MSERLDSGDTGGVNGAVTPHELQLSGPDVVPEGTGSGSLGIIVAPDLLHRVLHDEPEDGDPGSLERGKEGDAIYHGLSGRDFGKYTNYDRRLMAGDL